MTLQNFEKAREAMVLSQLQPSGVVDPGVNAVYFSTPREMFVPSRLRGVSYLDNDLDIGNGRFLLEPLLHALMVQDADLKKTDKVLDIGGATGYSAAILAQLAGEVVSVEVDTKLAQDAIKNWETLGLGNIKQVIGQHKDGYAKESPYAAIFINGAIAEVPQELLKQLAKGGCLYAVVLADGQQVGKLTAFRKADHGEIQTRILSNSTTSYVAGFEPCEKFDF